MIKLIQALQARARDLVGEPVSAHVIARIRELFPVDLRDTACLVAQIAPPARAEVRIPKAGVKNATMHDYDDDVMLATPYDWVEWAESPVGSDAISCGYGLWGFALSGSGEDYCIRMNDNDTTILLCQVYYSGISQDSPTNPDAVRVVSESLADLIQELVVLRSPSR